MDTKSIVRVKESDYLARIRTMKRQIRDYEREGDVRRAAVSKDMLASYEATGNAMLPIGSVKLEIIEG